MQVVGQVEGLSGDDKKKRTSTFKRRPRILKKARVGKCPFPSVSRKRELETESTNSEVQKRVKIRDDLLAAEWRTIL